LKIENYRCYNKQKLHQIKDKICVFLTDKLQLTMHPKKVNIFPTEKGVDFLGYRVFTNYRLLRKSTVKRFIKRTKKIKDKKSVESWMAYAKFADSWRLRKSLSKKLNVDLI